MVPASKRSLKLRFGTAQGSIGVVQQAVVKSFLATARISEGTVPARAVHGGFGWKAAVRARLVPSEAARFASLGVVELVGIERRPLVRTKGQGRKREPARRGVSGGSGACGILLESEANSPQPTASNATNDVFPHCLEYDRSMRLSL